MKGHLLDTNISIIGLAQERRVPLTVREQIESAPCYLSVITFWEVVLKSMKGKLSIAEPQAWWQRALADFEAIPLQLKQDHVAGVCNLPFIHTDPYDRILIAQAIAEDLTIVTTDVTIAKYSVPVILIP